MGQRSTWQLEGKANRGTHHPPYNKQNKKTFTEKIVEKNATQAEADWSMDGQDSKRHPNDPTHKVVQNRKMMTRYVGLGRAGQNSHCVGAGRRGVVEVPLGQEQVLRHTFPGLVHVAHAEESLRRHK